MTPHSASAAQLTAPGAYPGLHLQMHGGGILEVVLQNDRTLNSVNAAAHRALTVVWRDIDAAEGVRCVLIRGEGRGFSSGGDFELIEEMASDFTALARVWREARDLVYNVINCGKPVVSAIHGPCVGAGLAVALLADVGLKDNAVYIGYYGQDLHLSRDPKQPVISRGVPIAKALEEETMIAWAMNGQDIPLVHGYPLRLVIGGWPASVSGKWLHTIAIRDKVHDGAKMTGKSYRIPIHPVVPGVDPPDSDFKIIESMPVKSVITSPKTGLELPMGQPLALRGHAWAGDRTVKELHVSIDFGQTWQKAALKAPKNRLAWQHWTAEVKMPIQGYYEVWARATDDAGVAQPMVMPQWNPEGYINNACHRIALKVV